jgi:hypothetical protein
MIADFPITKQSSEQGQGVLREGGISKRLLFIQGSGGTTAWLAVIVQMGIHDLRIKLGGRTQS